MINVYFSIPDWMVLFFCVLLSLSTILNIYKIYLKIKKKKLINKIKHKGDYAGTKPIPKTLKPSIPPNPRPRH